MDEQTLKRIATLATGLSVHALPCTGYGRLRAQANILPGLQERALDNTKAKSEVSCLAHPCYHSGRL